MRLTRKGVDTLIGLTASEFATAAGSMTLTQYTKAAHARYLAIVNRDDKAEYRPFSDIACKSVYFFLQRRR